MDVLPDPDGAAIIMTLLWLAIGKERENVQITAAISSQVCLLLWPTVLLSLYYV